MSRVQTSVSPDVQKRSVPFVNVSGEKVPPFACMQIVDDPKRWKASLSAIPSEFGKGVFKFNQLGSSGQFANAVSVFCDKPSVASEYYQDPTMMLFNGDSEVAKDGTGRGFYWEYPIRALCGGQPKGISSWAVSRDRWYLQEVNGWFGGFRSVFNGGGQIVDADFRENGVVTPYQARVYNVVPNVQRTRVIPRAEGTFNIAGIGKFTLARTAISTYGWYTPGGLGIDGIYTSTPSLTLNTEGEYIIAMQAVFKTRGTPPASLRSIPFQIDITPYDRASENRFTASAGPLLSLTKLLQPPGTNSWTAGWDDSTPGDKVWARLRVWNQYTVVVNKAPATLMFHQKTTPYVETPSTPGSGRWSTTLMTEDGNYYGSWTNNPYYGWAGAWGYYGWYGWQNGFAGFGYGNVLTGDPGSSFANVTAIPFVDPLDL